MSKSDKSKLLILGVAVCLILVSVACIYGTKMIPLQIIVGITLIVQCFILAPICNERYCMLYEAEPRLSRYVPLWNEIQILSPVAAISTLVFCILSACVFGLSKVPLSLIYKITGLRSMVNWGYNCVVIAIMILVVADFLLGCGLIGVLRNVNVTTAEVFNGKPSKLEVAYYFLAFIPFLRICYFIALYQKLKTLFDSGILDDDTEEYVEEDM